MIFFRALVGITVGLLCLPPAAAGPDGLLACGWFENFEAYNVGDGMHGQGGWEGREGDPAWDAYVTDAPALLDYRSVDIAEDADLVHEFCGCTFGRWTFLAWQYVPDDFSGESYFVLLNTYGAGVHNWSTQLRFDSALGVVESEHDGAQLPLITGEWVELRVEIDLEADSQTIYYADQELVTKSWSAGVGNPGTLSIEAVDLFANDATSVYYDNLGLHPQCCADLDNDEDVDLADLALLLSDYGISSGACYDDGDLDLDGDVDLTDLGLLLAIYGTTCK